MSDKSKQRYEIYKGPNKFDIAIGLLQGAGGAHQAVHFEVLRVSEFEGTICSVPGEEVTGISVRLNGVSREDGSGESWCFSGYTTHIGLKEISKEVSGYYRTDKRRGYLRVVLD